MSVFTAGKEPGLLSTTRPRTIAHYPATIHPSIRPSIHDTSVHGPSTHLPMTHASFHPLIKSNY